MAASREDVLAVRFEMTVGSVLKVMMPMRGDDAAAPDSAPESTVML